MTQFFSAGNYPRVVATHKNSLPIRVDAFQNNLWYSFSLKTLISRIFLKIVECVQCEISHWLLCNWIMALIIVPSFPFQCKKLLIYQLFFSQCKGKSSRALIISKTLSSDSGELEICQTFNRDRRKLIQVISNRGIEPREYLFRPRGTHAVSFLQEKLGLYVPFSQVPNRLLPDE